MYRLGKLDRAYFTGNDGYSLINFYHKIEALAPTILLVRTNKSAVFGAFLTASWWEGCDFTCAVSPIVGRDQRHDEHFFGNGESFVFRCTPAFAIHRWVGINILTGACIPVRRILPLIMCRTADSDLFQHGDAQSITIGGGGAGGPCSAAQASDLHVFRACAAA